MPFGFSSVARFPFAPLPSSPLLEAFNSAAFIRAEVLDELGHRRLSAFQSVLDVSIAWGAFDGDPDPFRPMSAIHDCCFKTGTPCVLVHSEPHFPTRHGSCRFHVDEHASASRQSVPELVGLSDLTPCVPLMPRRCAGFPSGSRERPPASARRSVVRRSTGRTRQPRSSRPSRVKRSRSRFDPRHLPLRLSRHLGGRPDPG
jgi:hypothetical protein